MSKIERCIKAADKAGAKYFILAAINALIAAPKQGETKEVA